MVVHHNEVKDFEAKRTGFSCRTLRSATNLRVLQKGTLVLRCAVFRKARPAGCSFPKKKIQIGQWDVQSWSKALKW